MFLFMLVCASAVTVAPGAERRGAIAMLIILVLSILFGLTALLLRRKFDKDPESGIFKSKVASAISVGFATVLTLIFVFGVLA